ncbi:histidine phosphatase family protein [Plantactinospora solaniradicis]|uniref:Histidine phosphatase family protein n=1 Tax=Plantactinospora solaniradicis TaxID=1723736 RepID=A0ABW1KGB2_9ACTN
MTATSLLLVAHAHTAAIRRAVFGGGAEPLDEGGSRAALALAPASPDGRGLLGRIDVCLSTPAVAGLQTAYALGLQPTLEPALADCDYGRWTGQPLDEVADWEPDAVRSWLTEPDAAPHGGESVSALLHRVGGWLDGQADRGGRIGAVTHPVVIRAVLVRALRLPPTVFWQLDVAPLAVVRLTGRGSRWQLHLTAPAATTS